jgi:hypothetical protein
MDEYYLLIPVIAIVLLVVTLYSKKREENRLNGIWQRFSYNREEKI